MNHDREHIVKRYEDNPAFGTLEKHIQRMDPDYADCIVLGVADELKLGKESLCPPDGCLFVTIRTRENKRILLTIQDVMFTPDDAEQSDFRVSAAAMDALVEASRVAYSIGSSGKTVLCEITLPNGFVCSGIAQVVDPQNFRFSIGASIALLRAREQVANILAERKQAELAAFREAEGIQTR
jgi:hypothetical protein